MMTIRRHGRKISSSTITCDRCKDSIRWGVNVSFSSMIGYAREKGWRMRKGGELHLCGRCSKFYDMERKLARKSKKEQPDG